MSGQADKAKPVSWIIDFLTNTEKYANPEPENGDGVEEEPPASPQERGEKPANDELVVKKSEPSPDARAGPAKPPGEATSGEKPPRFKLLSFDEASSIAPIKWRVKGVLPETGIAVIFGASGSGKTFIALYLAMAIAKGDKWFGKRTTPCPVVYVGLEGEAGISNRLTAYKKRKKVGGEPYFMTDPFNLMEEDDVFTLAEAIKAKGAINGVVIIDTFNRATPGMDENSSSDMGLAIAGVKRLQAILGGVVLLVHHTGKDASKGMRGHSSLFAALDAAIEVCPNKTLRITKSKDGESGNIGSFSLDPVILGKDEDGDSITSCVVVPTGDQDEVEVEKSRVPTGKNQMAIFKCITELLKHSEERDKGGCPAEKPCIEKNTVILKLRESLVGNNRKSERTEEALKSLIKGNFIKSDGSWIWMA